MKIFVYVYKKLLKLKLKFYLKYSLSYFNFDDPIYFTFINLYLKKLQSWSYIIFEYIRYFELVNIVF